MALLDFFKRTPEKNILPEKQIDMLAVDNNLYLLETLNDRLIEMGYRVERHPQYLALIINSEIEIATIIVENPENHPSILHLMISVSHSKYFPNGIIENVVGMGLSIQDKVSSALDNYINSTFITIIDGFSDRHNPTHDFMAKANGKDVLWHPKLGTLNFQGQWNEHPQSEPLFELLLEMIPDRLTLKKINWLKIYISKRSDGTIIGECLFNNEQWPAALNKISNYAQSWEMNGEFQGLKQFIIFRLCDAYDKLID